MKMNRVALLAALVASLASVNLQASIVTTVSGTSAEVEMAIGVVSNTDLAAGVPTVRNFGGGNFNAAVTTDGVFGTGFNNNASNGPDAVRYQVDLGSLQLIEAVNTYSGTGNDPFRGGQDFTLYGSVLSGDLSQFDETNTAIYTEINTVLFENDGITTTTFGGSSISDIDASFQTLLWVANPISTRGGGEATVFKEFDVIAGVAVPEPTSAVLLGLSAMGMTLVRRRR